MQTALSDHHRHQYLKALGIPIWRERGVVGDDAEPITINEEAQAVVITPPKATSTLRDTPKEPLKEQQNPPLSAIKTVDASRADWSQLQTMIQSCKHCPLHDARHQAILGSGNHNTRYMIIADTPSEQDDRQNQLFAAKPGQLLNNMLKAIGLDRHSIYITTTIKCRTPADRSPHTTEQAQCRSYLERQIELINPHAIFVIGHTASQTLLQKKQPMSQLRGKIHQLTLKNSTKKIPTIVSFHPRSLLRQPQNKAKAWQDLKQLVLSIDIDNE